MAQPETLFRGTSLEMRIVSHYLHRECGEFLRSSLLPVFSWLARYDYAFEVDGTKELVATNRDRNARLLIEAASKLLASVTDSDSSGKSFPRSAAELLRLVRAIVDKKMPAMSDRAVASLLFLRLVNPALCSPDVFLGVAEPAPHTRRTLILLSKLLQNLANGVMFGEKESYLEFANGWIASSRSQLSSFVFDTVFGIRKVRDFPCCDVFFSRLVSGCSGPSNSVSVSRRSGFWFALDPQLFLRAKETRHIRQVSRFLLQNWSGCKEAKSHVRFANEKSNEQFSSFAARRHAARLG